MRAGFVAMASPGLGPAVICWPVPMTGESPVLGHAGGGGWVTAADGGLQVTGGGALAARAHDSDPQGGRVAQVAGGSGVRPASCPFRCGGGDIPRGRSAPTMTALEAVTPGAGTASSRAR